MIEQKAYAKINLSLEVIEKRKDGYHEIVSVMQMVDLHDTLLFSPADELSVECDDPALAAEGEGNLVWKAARLLQEHIKESRGARIELHKRIPMSAGLAGGSSDAAATLRGLSQLWGLGMSRSELRLLGATLGSDVPFFMGSPTALVEGRGERVTPLPSPPPGWAVLVCRPYDLPNKTQQLYGNLIRGDMTGGNSTQQLVYAIVQEEFPRSDLLHNAFERAAFTVFEGLEKVCRKMLHTSGRDAHLSGSGPTLFTLFPESQRLKAEALHETLQAEGLRTFLTHMVGR